MSDDDPVIIYLDNTELYGPLKKAIKNFLCGNDEFVSTKFLDFLKEVQENDDIVVLTSELAEFESIRNLLTEFPELSFDKAYSSVFRLRGKYNIKSIDLRAFKTSNMNLDFFKKTGFDYKDGLHYQIAQEYDAYIISGDKKFKELAEKINPGKVIGRKQAYKLFRLL